ncbi:hypothetical protein FQA39_LY11009 [Lamprigera yunnana]|nr:hypothetical protein FQA39_LY11009 [Lamprigera yunnana]
MGNVSSVDIPGGGTEGYHVLRVQENSPGSRAGLQAFFDFIIAINGTRLDQDNETLKQVLKNAVGKQVPMTVYSSKTQAIRSITIEPNEDWGGQGLLGVSIRFCSFEGANENVWHILEVHPSSPAEIAGLRSFTDYIIGADSILHESEDFFTLIEAHEARSLKLYVYNSTDDCCREVTITPHRDWGGEGSLGCGIGYGYLHRIPIRGPEIKTALPQTVSYDNLLKSETSPNFSTTSTINTAGTPLMTPQPVIPVPQYSIATQMYANPSSSNVPTSATANVLPPLPATIFNTPVTTVINPVYPMSVPMYNTSPPLTNITVQSNYSQLNPINPMYSTTMPPNTMPHASSCFTVPAQTNLNLTPSIHLEMTQSPSLIYDPTIAAQSAQQLLSNSNPPLSL